MEAARISVPGQMKFKDEMNKVEDFYKFENMQKQVEWRVNLIKSRPYWKGKK